MPITLSVPEMTCEGCEDIIETAATEVANVESAEADRHQGTVEVVGEPDEQDLLQAIDFAGYEAELLEEDEDETEEAETAETASDAEAETDEDEPIDEPAEEGSVDDSDEDVESGDDGDDR